MRNTEREPLSRNIYALEGIGGSGKSHTLLKLNESLAQDGKDVVIVKIAGLGDSPRVSRLKKVLESREEKRKNGEQTAEHLEDHRKQRLFRLATRYQSRAFLNSLSSPTENKYYLLDRTPLMTLAFCLAEDPGNPYLYEIRDEALKLTKELGIKRVFLLDIDPINSISRQLARSAVGHDDQDSLIKDVLDIILPPEEIRDKIVLTTEHILRENPDLLPKQFSLWDYSDFNVISGQSLSFRHALEMARQNIGLEYTIVDTSQPIGEVVSLIKTQINND